MRILQHKATATTFLVVGMKEEEDPDEHSWTRDDDDERLSQILSYLEALSSSCHKEQISWTFRLSFIFDISAIVCLFGA